MRTRKIQSAEISWGKGFSPNFCHKVEHTLKKVLPICSILKNQKLLMVKIITYLKPYTADQIEKVFFFHLVLNWLFETFFKKP